MSKVLFIGQTFHSVDGGGITLSNLMKGYPNEKIAVASTYNSIILSNPNISSYMYCFGTEEKVTLFPFSLFKRKHKSGPYNSKVLSSELKTGMDKKELQKKLLSYLHIVGLDHKLERLFPSSRFLQWFDTFGPDVVYTQLSTYESILFIKALQKVRNFKLVIHIMDDWPSTIVKRGIFSSFWRKKIESEFRDLLQNSYKRLAISEYMTLEYFKRYNCQWTYYHNPIDINFWQAKLPKIDAQEKKQITYTGRVGKGISSSLLELAKAVQILYDKYKGGYILLIQTMDTSDPICKDLKKFPCVHFNKYVEYSKLPELFHNSDLLILPYDFSGEDYMFIKFSMPTKASEYIASGTPVLYFGPSDTALCYHAKKYEWGHIVDVNDHKFLSDQIEVVLHDTSLIQKYKNNSLGIAKSQFEISKVSSSFQQEFS